jgi:hypothetical protein
MFGPLVIVDTQTAAISLDINRTLYLGPVAVLRLTIPDETADDGMRLVRAITTGFDRVSDDEEERGAGQTVVYEIADLALQTDPGQLEADLKEAQYAQLVVGDDAGPFLKMNDVPRPAINVAQVYVVTCVTRTMKQTYSK